MIFAELRLKYGPPAIGFSAIADDEVFGYRFSAIARSVMIFAKKTSEQDASYPSFSAIARSVMIFA